MLLRIAAGVFSAIGLSATAVGVWFQYAAYREEAFSREFGSLALAWDIIAKSNGVRNNIGQGDALTYLVKSGNLISGNVSLNETSIIGFNFYGDEIGFPFNDSSFCKTQFTLGIMRGATLNNSLFIGSSIMSVDMSGANAAGARFNGAQLIQVIARNVRFVATDFSGASFRGGDFTSADFTGADLRGVKTLPLLYGTGPNLSAPSSAFFDPSIPDREAWAMAGKDPWMVTDPASATKKQTTFRDATFQLADIRGADLKETDISQAQVDSACADRSTKLPEGVSVRETCTPDVAVDQRRAALQRGLSTYALTGPCRPEAINIP